MKQFFWLVFGGLTAVGTGIGLVYAGFWIKEATPALTAVAANGFKSFVTYTANEEEDLINIAEISLPADSKKITAKAYLVKNLTGNKVLVAENSDQLLPIASITKLVTAVVARKYIPSSAKITISESIIRTYGNTAGFKVGETFSAGDLLYPLLMVSSNDAAEAYAYAYGRDNFVTAMNDFTQEIGAYRTYFKDPSGLSASNVSTPNDLALILDWIQKNDPEIIQITGLQNKSVRNHNWVNPTHFLSWSNYKGGKNGYIPEANKTAASLFTAGSDKNLYAIIVLGSDSRDADELRLLRQIHD